MFWPWSRDARARHVRAQVAAVDARVTVAFRERDQARADLALFRAEVQVLREFIAREATEQTMTRLAKFRAEHSALAASERDGVRKIPEMLPRSGA